jgi:hypothetical protein
VEASKIRKNMSKREKITGNTGGGGNKIMGVYQ